MAWTAALPPASLASKYGFPRFFGMNTTLRGLLEPEALLPEDDDPVEALLHPVRASATDRVAAPIKPPRRLRMRIAEGPFTSRGAGGCWRAGGAISPSTPGRDAGDPRQDGSGEHGQHEEQSDDDVD